jgi:biotin operon repressor
MNTPDDTTALLTFFKALADANRLKIVGLLAREALSVEQIAAMLNLHASTVSHHLGQLAQAGLVSARAEGYYSVYQLETKALEALAQRLLAREILPGVAEELDVEAFDRKVLKTYLNSEGKLVDFPTQHKKEMVILRYVVQAFEPGVRYTEKQVNQILARYHDDTARLRRYLIDAKLMAREDGGRAYWRL